ncbi:hypothetical protein T03_10456 [Trichinella britovi]|uniref:Uncharacterized protein n=1 Tax=Trichinella britovi TaxID=45882 RepID=A0A0V1ANP2_TRIBR|nr:hypothetical protein T03_10456 [Trichinella britovi]
MGSIAIKLNYELVYSGKNFHRLFLLDYVTLIVVT